VIDQAGRVVHEIEVALPQDEVFEFPTDARRLARWIGLSASLSPVPGGRSRSDRWGHCRVTALLKGLKGRTHRGRDLVTLSSITAR
jgi:uncharacterized protein YndB with AHSA1/START domain